MGVIDIVRWDGASDELIWKFPNSQLSTATQLIVGETQVATLFKDGQRYDVFSAGRHTLKTANIPLLGSLVNLPFGGASPFLAEVWFANKAIPLNLKWGTANPIQLEDPQYGVVLPVSAFGQLGIEIVDTSLLISTLIGRLPSFRASHVLEYFKGVMMAELRASIASAVAKRQVGLLQIETELVSISDSVARDIQPHFQRFGLDLHLFRIMSITFPQDDPSVVELRRAKANAMRRKVEGTSYQQERSFDVMQNAASNQGMGGAFAAAGSGLAIGQAVGSLAASQLPGAIAAHASPPPFVEIAYHVRLGATQLGPLDLQQVQQLASEGRLQPSTPVWKVGLPAWCPAQTMPELGALFAPPPFTP